MRKSKICQFFYEEKVKQVMWIGQASQQYGQYIIIHVNSQRRRRRLNQKQRFSALIEKKVPQETTKSNAITTMS